jgi:hypothetical protein
MYHRLKIPYPMARSSHRTLPPDYAGPVFIWDIDKTYLDTHFHSLGGLLKIPLELGIDKSAVRGAPELLHALRDGQSGKANQPLFFISASPYQIRKSIERKMLLDGIDFDGISFKDPLRVAKKLRFDELKNQVPFKLAALLLLVQELPKAADLYLFGDDAESDAQIYSLFADMIAGRFTEDQLMTVLNTLKVRKSRIEKLIATLQSVEACERVRGILIRLTNPDSIHKLEGLDPRILGWASPASCVNYLKGRSLVGGPGAERVLATCPDQRCIQGTGNASSNGAWFRPSSLEETK